LVFDKIEGRKITNDYIQKLFKKIDEKIQEIKKLVV